MCKPPSGGGEVKLFLISTSGLLATAARAQTIAYITNGNTNEGWSLINGGARAAGQAPGISFIELAAEKGELSSQLAMVEDLITRKVDAIAIAPVDSAGIAPAVNQALAAGIPVVAVDTGIRGARVTAYGIHLTGRYLGRKVAPAPPRHQSRRGGAGWYAEAPISRRSDRAWPLESWHAFFQHRRSRAGGSALPAAAAATLGSG
ncbi:MAG TPA: sugar ABC transporter substrate-binding protein [Chromatiaceae bacterium]|nr:sugar ABC transporter substrate-binding protein [Chromatiaceae bacterium]